MICTRATIANVSRHHAPSPEVRKHVADLAGKIGFRSAARELGVGRATAQRIAAGAPVSLVALDKIKPRVRSRSEFTLTGAHRALRRTAARSEWTIQSIRAARDAQSAGFFALPIALAQAMRNDDAIYNARRTRIEALTSITSRLVAAPGARGEGVARKAGVSVFTPRSVIKSILGTYVDHGVAIGHVERETTADGARVDFRLREWPLEHVRWYAQDRCFRTAVECGPETEIVHGNGEWVIFRGSDSVPWLDGTILPAALVFASHLQAIQSWASALASHGDPKVTGELPAGFALAGDEPGTLSPDAAQFLEMIESILSGQSVTGIRPNGAKLDVLFNGSNAWQIFKEMVDNREKAAARIYLGTDAILGSVGGAPGVDIAQLFGVSTTLLQSDLGVIEDCLRTGVFEPWAAINFGDSAHAPVFSFDIPDPDGDSKAKARNERRQALLTQIKLYRDLGMTIDQDTINALARELGVERPPILATAMPPEAPAAPAAPATPT
jgi:hypothetical protein